MTVVMLYIAAGITFFALCTIEQAFDGHSKDPTMSDVERWMVGVSLFFIVLAATIAGLAILVVKQWS